MELSATELRIGNLVGIASSLNFSIGKVTLISNNRILLENKISSKNHKFIPIPLTEEWLLRFGFEKKYGIYNPSYNLEIQKTDFYLRNCFLGGFYWGFNISKCNDCELCDVMPLQYVHQLQNLYFALTGEELEIKL